MTKVSKNLTENFDALGHLSTFGAENTIKSGPFKTGKNTKTLSKQLENNFEKVQNKTFSTPRMAKNDPSKRSKLVKF